MAFQIVLGIDLIRLFIPSAHVAILDTKLIYCHFYKFKTNSIVYKYVPSFSGSVPGLPAHFTLEYTAFTEYV